MPRAVLPHVHRPRPQAQGAAPCVRRCQCPPGERQAQKLGTVLEPELDREGDDLRNPFHFRWHDRLYFYYAGGLEAAIGIGEAR